MIDKYKKYKQGLVFGVFDGFHLGHQYFLTEALKRSDKLVVVVTLDEVVEKLKKRLPTNSFAERAVKIKQYNSDLEVVPGDLVLGEWRVLQVNFYDIIWLGYDQTGIAKELDKLKITYKFLEAYEPETYKSSLLYNKD